MAIKLNNLIKTSLLSIFFTYVCCCPGLSKAQEESIESLSVDSQLRVAMLHLDLKYADIDHNLGLIESGVQQAAALGANWVLTPELALTGYRFDLKLGTDWIQLGPDESVKGIQKLAKESGVTVFLSHLERAHLEGAAPERNYETKKSAKKALFNTLFVIGKNGEILGRHRKINTIPIAESWSTPGKKALSLDIDGINVGLLICADAWPEEHTQYLKEQRVDLIVSSASWAPGEYGPKDTWEKRSIETGIPFFVNNRTGFERGLDLTESKSVVSIDGSRVMSHSSITSKIVVFDWHQGSKKLSNQATFDLIHQNYFDGASSD